MATPRTKQPILLKWEIDAIAKAKTDFESTSALKVGGRNSTNKNNFLKCLTKFVMVLALNFHSEPRVSVKYDFAAPTTKEVRFAIYQEIFQKLGVQMVWNDNISNSDETRVGGLGNEDFRLFWEDYVLDLVDTYGGSGKHGVELMSILCTSIPKKGGFNLCTGSSIKTLGDDAINEYRRFEERFRTYLGPDEKPPSGKTWEMVLEEFRTQLYVDMLTEKQAKKSEASDKKKGTADLTPSNDHSEEEGNEEEKEAIRDVLDPYEVSGDPPAGWLPGGSHAWLLFVCYGYYGRAVFDSTAPNNLRTLSAEEIDSIKTSRRASKTPDMNLDSVSSATLIGRPTDPKMSSIVDSKAIMTHLERFDLCYKDEMDALKELIDTQEGQRKMLFETMQFLDPVERMNMFETARQHVVEATRLRSKKDELAREHPVKRAKYEKQLMARFPGAPTLEEEPQQLSFEGESE